MFSWFSSRSYYLIVGGSLSFLSILIVLMPTRVDTPRESIFKKKLHHRMHVGQLRSVCTRVIAGE